MKTVNKSLLSFCIIMLLAGNAKAQKGPFIKISIGTGYTTEYSGLNAHGHSMINKNHAIGWGITEDFALQIGEFGSLNKINTGEKPYVNTDAYGLGFSYRTPIDLIISSLAAYSLTSFEDKWWGTGGAVQGRGFGLNISIDKEWSIAQRWSLRLGPQFYWIKTKDSDYEFFNISINGSVVFHLNPIKR
jgi:hypothetical protein